MARPIRFFSRKKKYSELSNFAPFGFYAEGVHWPTVEHYFQAKKFVGPDLAEHRERIRQAHSPRQAKALGQSRKHPLRSDWDEVKERIMLEALRLKFADSNLRDLLLSTGDRPLIEASPYDGYWGAGSNRRGKNRLGQLLVQVRNELRKHSDA
ncbi:MAG TPA: NADAR family protein [Vicinamibacteria bacterium]|nr:NADAR family protein [Vicinamibacteria bacterium]